MLDIVWLAEIKWDYLKTRKQQIIRRRPDDVRVLFLEPYVKGRENVYSIRDDDGVLHATVPFIKSVPNPLLRSMLDVPAARGAVDRWAFGKIGPLIRAAGFDPENVGLILSNVFAIRVAERVHHRYLIYDCNDAHSAFPGMPAWTADYFERSCRDADLVIATAQALVEQVSSLREDGRCTLVGNGVEYRRFAAAAGSAAPQRPVAGYLGAIAPWLDFGCLADVARHLPDWRVELVGPVLGGAEAKLRELTALPNVTRREAVPHEEVPEVLSRFTIGLIPFRYDELTRGVNPNKMYEYLAAGVPVVATRFSPEVMAYPELVRAEDPGPEFIAACEAMGGLRAEARFTADAARVAGEHDWEVMAKAFWGEVRRASGSAQ